MIDYNCLEEAITIFLIKNTYYKSQSTCKLHYEMLRVLPIMQKERNSFLKQNMAR